MLSTYEPWKSILSSVRMWSIQVAMYICNYCTPDGCHTQTDACGINSPLPGPPLPGPPLPLPPRPPRYAKFTLSCFSPYCCREYAFMYSICIHVQYMKLYVQLTVVHTHTHILYSEKFGGCQIWWNGRKCQFFDIDNVLISWYCHWNLWRNYTACDEAMWCAHIWLHVYFSESLEILRLEPSCTRFQDLVFK